MNMVWHDYKARQAKTAPQAGCMENFADKGSFGRVKLTQAVAEVGGNKKQSFRLCDPAQPTHDTEAYISTENKGKGLTTGEDACEPACGRQAFLAATWEEAVWVAARKMRQ